MMLLQQLHALEQRYLWERDYKDAPVWIRAGISTLRIIVLLIRDLMEGDVNMRAMSMVYTTLLSMVPLLALSFSILKGFGVQNELDDALVTALAPLGEEKAAQLTDNIINFVNNMNVGVLGAMGLVFLVYTVVSLMQKIERSFNHVWRIRTDRSFGERFATFLSAITIGPLLIFAAIAITGTAMNTSIMSYLQSLAIIGDAIEITTRLVPFALVIIAFTFLYAFIPYTRVRISAALTGGVVAGVLWEALSFAFASFASGASNYQAIYATFASAVLFMIWLYLNWLILLIGASIAFYKQHPEVVATGLREIRFSPALLNHYALSLLARIGRRFYGDEAPSTVASLAAEYGVPGHALERVLALLVEIGVLAETDDPEPRYVPSVPFDTTPVADVLERIEAHQPTATFVPSLDVDARIIELKRTISEGRVDALGGLTLKALALEVAPVAETPAHAG